MQTLLQDLRYGARMLMKNPGFTLIVVLATALGISAVTTTFSNADAMLFRPFSFTNQDRLMIIFERIPDAGMDRGSVSPGNIMEWRAQAQTLQEVVAMRNRDYTLTGDGPTERYPSYGVSAAFFDALGVQPQLGRTFRRGEDEPGSEQVVVLRHAFWQKRFAGDPRIIGKRIILDDKPFEVIGVMPKDFDFPYGGGEMWTPFVIDQQMKRDHANHYLRVMALLKPGATLAQAEGELSAISKRIRLEFPDQESGHAAFPVALNREYTREAKMYFQISIGSALFVLLIACSNIANLLLSRSASRRKEIALRLALGATRWRLIRQLMTESALLALIGGAMGCVLAGWGIDLVSKGIPDAMSKYIPGWSRLGLNYAALAFTALVSILTGVIFGLAPALYATRVNLNDDLKDGEGKGSSGKGGRSKLRGAFVVSELALSLVLLIGAGLLVRTFINILRADLGVKPANVVTMSLELPREQYATEELRRNFFRQLLQRAESLPGVTNAGAVDDLPMSGGQNLSAFQIVGRPEFEKGKEPYTMVRITTPGYFGAIGTQLRTGRLFSPRDDEQALKVILVNEAFADKYLKVSDPVGQRLRFGDASSPASEIVGVVANVMNDDFDRMTDPAVYLPFAQAPSQRMTLVVRAPGSESQIIPALRNELAALDPRLPFTDVKSMEQVIYERRSPKEMMMWMLVVFGGMALLMASVGAYAVMAYSVSQRTREIGVRMAMGALPSDILKLVMRRGILLVLFALGLGMAGAYALTGALAGLLYGVSPTDPVTFIFVPLALAAIALLACWIPARRAAKVDPMIALRQD